MKDLLEVSSYRFRENNRVFSIRLSPFADVWTVMDELHPRLIWSRTRGWIDFSVARLEETGFPDWKAAYFAFTDSKPT
jgi:hypothetical protein